MQKWEYKLGEGQRFVKVEGGFQFNRNGATFTEIKSADGKGNTMLLAELVDPKGGVKYDVMSADNWSVLAHNADAVVACRRAYQEGAKARLDAKREECKTQAATLKGAGLNTVEVSAILKSRGYAEADVVEAIK
jgi:hypothetical protein